MSTKNYSLAKNVALSLMGTVVPLLVAIYAVPVLANGLGTAGFGVLMLAWMVVGYFSLFDLGLGRAITKLVAEKLGEGNNADIPQLIWTGMALMACFGLFGGILFSLLSSWVVMSVLEIPVELKRETLVSFYFLAFSIPVVICSTGLRGILEAHQRFGLVNAVRIPVGVFTFLGPVIALSIAENLISVVVSLVLMRLVAFFAYLLLCLHVEPRVRKVISIDKSMAMSLLGFGGWMTVTNIVGPLMVYLDRFLLGALVSMVAVAYYATPYEIVTKLWVISGALMSVLFPAFALHIARDKEYAVHLFRRAVSYVFVAVFPFVLIIVTFAYEGLYLWLGVDFANNSAIILQLLAVGVLINSLANVPFGLIQGAGRPDLTAKLHLIELPFYLFMIWGMLSFYGTVGVAIAWVIRVTVDMIALFVLASKLLPVGFPFGVKPTFYAGMAFLLLITGALIQGEVIKLVFLAAVISTFILVSWYFILVDAERKSVHSYLFGRGSSCE